MAVYTEESVRANIRVRDGKRVFYQADGDHLTPSAREWLRQERIEILPAAEAKPKVYRTLTGAVLTEKPEHMTHLRADVLVPKDHEKYCTGEITQLLQRFETKGKLIRCAVETDEGSLLHLEERLCQLRQDKKV